MTIIIFAIVFSIALAAVIVMWGRYFLKDSFGWGNAQALPVLISVALAVGILNGLAMYFGWTPFFVIMASIICVAQLLHFEAWAKLALYAVVLSQIPAALAQISNNVRAGQWEWGNWFLVFLVWPIIEVLVFNLVSFISKEQDAHRDES